MNGITSRKSFRLYQFIFLITNSAFVSSPSVANELIVNITGLKEPFGTVGCSLFKEQTGFPMDISKENTEWIPALGGTVICRFKDILPGDYAVSVVHDINNNQKVDTNLIGIPTEQWGVSNNFRPPMRAPRFEEAKFTLPTDSLSYLITVQVAK